MNIKYFIFALILLFSNALQTAHATQLEYKLKILKKEESFLGCFGENCNAGCSQNLFIMENSSLSFPCEEKAKNFNENHIYVFLEKSDYFACPTKTFSKKTCLSCRECGHKRDQMKKMNIK